MHTKYLKKQYLTNTLVNPLLFSSLVITIFINKKITLATFKKQLLNEINVYHDLMHNTDPLHWL